MRHEVENGGSEPHCFLYHLGYVREKTVALVGGVEEGTVVNGQ